jgi:hypothetical protein
VLKHPLGKVALVVAAVAVLRALSTLGLELYADEAYYWLWSRRPALGYFDHPPMVAWLIGLSSAVFPGELGVRLPFVVCGALAVFFAALTARELSDDPRAPVYAALLAATAPLLNVTGALALPDAPLEAAYAGAVWLLARARGRRWAWVGLAVGLALLSKYSAALLAPALVLLVVWDGELRRELRTPWPWIGAAVAIAVFSPTLAWDAQRGFASIGFQLHHGFHPQPSLRTFLPFLGAQLVAPGPIVYVSLGALVRAREPAWKRVAAAALVPMAVTIYSATRADPEVNWTVHAFPPLCAAAGAWLATRRVGRPLLLAHVALGVVAACALVWIQRDPRFAGNAVYDRFHGWREFAGRMHEAAAAGCAEAGLQCDLRDPFVFPANYRYAGAIAYYGGWQRSGRAIARASQLDVWDEQPRPGEPVIVVADSPETFDRFKAHAHAVERSRPRVWEVRGGNGEPIRAGVTAPFMDVASVEFAR